MAKDNKRNLGCLFIFFILLCILISYFLLQHETFANLLKVLGNLGFWLIFAIILLFIIVIFQLLLFSVLGNATNRQTDNKNIISSPLRQYQIPDINPITFEDVAGLEDAKKECRRLINFLQNQEKFKKLGAKLPKGLIFEGPPGMGKTLLAKALASEAKVKFFYLSASELVELFVGVGASRIRNLFEVAKANSPCIIFIDELDAVGQKRAPTASFTSGTDEREQTLNQFLSSLDGLDTTEGIIVVAATNRFDVIDPALIRPGRFDSVVHVNISSLDDCIALVNIATKSMALSSVVSTSNMASKMKNFSGAEITATCNRAALLAGDEGVQEIGNLHFEDAINYMKQQRIIENSLDKIIESSTTTTVFAKDKLEIEIEKFPAGSLRCNLIWMSPYVIKVEIKNSNGISETLFIPRGSINSIKHIL
jgi:ATP-dependent metalloprotease FtsH